MENQYPVSAVKGMILREMRPDVADILARMQVTIGRIVDFGTHVFEWCGLRAENDPNLVPPLMLLHHAVEAVDAISVLLAAGCCDPCGALIRSEMEAALCALYIIQEDTPRRGLAYRYCLLQDRLTALERMDTATPRGQAQARRLQSDKVFGAPDALPPVDPAALAQQIQLTKELLAHTKYSELETEWSRLKRERGRAPYWYALFGGPSSISELAERVGWPAWYDLFYRQFSDEVHSASAMTSIKNDPEREKTLVCPFRFPKAADTCLQLSVSILLVLFQETIGRLCPDQAPTFLAWYVEHVSPEYEVLRKIKFK